MKVGDKKVIFAKRYLSCESGKVERDWFNSDDPPKCSGCDKSANFMVGIMETEMSGKFLCYDCIFSTNLIEFLGVVGSVEDVFSPKKEK